MQGLEGVKVLELGNMVSAAYATKLIADLGADVIKVEEPGGDHARQRGPFPKGVPDPEQSGLFLYLNTNKRGCTIDLRKDTAALTRLVAWADVLIHNPPGITPSLNTVGYFNQWNQGTKSMALDLSKPEAIAIANRLAATCDVVVQNFATGVMERLGLGYEELRKVKPDLIMASISGYGQTGPQRQYMGYGPAMGPLAGLASPQGMLTDLRKRLAWPMATPTAVSMRRSRFVRPWSHGSVLAKDNTSTCRSGSLWPC